MAPSPSILELCDHLAPRHLQQQLRASTVRVQDGAITRLSCELRTNNCRGPHAKGHRKAITAKFHLHSMHRVEAQRAFGTNMCSSFTGPPRQWQENIEEDICCERPREGRTFFSIARCLCAQKQTRQIISPHAPRVPARGGSSPDDKQPPGGFQRKNILPPSVRRKNQQHERLHLRPKDQTQVSYAHTGRMAVQPYLQTNIPGPCKDRKQIICTFQEIPRLRRGPCHRGTSQDARICKHADTTFCVQLMQHPH